VDRLARPRLALRVSLRLLPGVHELLARLEDLVQEVKHADLLLSRRQRVLDVMQQVLQDEADLLDLERVLEEVPDLPNEQVAPLDDGVIDLLDGKEQVGCQVVVHVLEEGAFDALDELLFELVAVPEDGLEHDVAELAEDQVP
jgi:hypothetical protein